jgi:hypothetical protein
MLDAPLDVKVGSILFGAGDSCRTSLPNIFRGQDLKQDDEKRREYKEANEIPST